MTLSRSNWNLDDKECLMTLCKLLGIFRTTDNLEFFSVLLLCSRRVFGVIEERCICIVLDVNTTSQSEFSTYLHVLVQALKEQVMFIAKFNLIRYYTAIYIRCICVTM